MPVPVMGKGPNGNSELTMKICKRGFCSQLLVWQHQLSYFNNPMLASTPLISWFSRKKSIRREIFGFSVYAVKGDPDMTFGFELVERALQLLTEHSPYWVEELRKQIKAVIIVPTKRAITIDRIARCCVINPFKFAPKNPENTEAAKRRTLGLLGALASSSQLMRLSKGRFGYVGIKHGVYFCMKTQIRVVRRCFSLDWQRAVLSEMATCYKVLDVQNLRPGRRYHPHFIKQEMERLSFGKKLSLHPAADTLVVEDELTA